MNTKSTEISPASINNSQAQSFFEILSTIKIFTSVSPLCQVDFHYSGLNHWIGNLKLLWQSLNANTIQTTAKICQSLGLNEEDFMG